jgi:hypothetical protein
MTYRIARNGQIFGPYTDAEVRQYLASGNIFTSDLVQADGAEDWVPVLELFQFVAAVHDAPQTAASAGGAGALYPDPPDFPWWGALLLGLITGGLFFVIWDIVQAAWVRRVQPTSNSLALYIAMAVLYLLRAPSNWDTINHNVFGGPPVGPHHGFLTFLVWLGLFIASRMVIRQDLLRHFNTVEPIGLRLNAFLVFLLGGLYIQYHFNQINEIKRAMHISVPA